jgi:hypothetical protein
MPGRGEDGKTDPARTRIGYFFAVGQTILQVLPSQMSCWDPRQSRTLRTGLNGVATIISSS